MKISYAITVCNEFEEIQKLVDHILENKRIQDEIVILYDKAHGNPKIEDFLRAKSINGEFNWHAGEFNNHFADWKNKLTSLCDGDYIVQLDADEIPNISLIENLPAILEANPNVDVYLVPRINTVDGLTLKHVEKWNWQVDAHGWVNWPDYQWRVYKNDGTVTWKNKVHEVLDGHKIYAPLPAFEEYSLYHHKTITKQEQQNEFYETI